MADSKDLVNSVIDMIKKDIGLNQINKNFKKSNGWVQTLLERNDLNFNEIRLQNGLPLSELSKKPRDNFVKILKIEDPQQKSIEFNKIEQKRINDVEIKEADKSLNISSSKMKKSSKNSEMQVGIDEMRKKLESLDVSELNEDLYKKILYLRILSDPLDSKAQLEFRNYLDKTSQFENKNQSRQVNTSQNFKIEEQASEMLRLMKNGNKQENKDTMHI